jgi:hypothetical protein
MGPLLRRLTPKGHAFPTDAQLSNATKMTGAINDMKALAAAFRALRELAFSEEILRNNQVPTLALIGAIDPLKEDVDAMAAKMKNITEMVIPNSDHMNAFAKPEFIKDLKEFLAKHPCTAPSKSAEKIAPAAERPEEADEAAVAVQPAPVPRFRHIFRPLAWARGW